MNNLKVTVVIPTLNEEKSIGKVIDGIKKELTGRYSYNILVVDGYSNDDTVKIAREKGARVIFQKGKGYGDAYLTGFEYVRKKFQPDIIVMMDGDCTYDPSDIPLLVDPVIRGKADMVIGNRFIKMEKGAMSKINRLGNKILSKIAQWTLNINVNDTQSGYRAFKTSILDNMSLNSSGMPFAIELLAEAYRTGLKVIEIPVSYHKRLGGASKLSPLKDGMRILLTIIRLFRDYKPLVFFGIIGLMLILAGILVGINVVKEWLATGTVKRVPSAILSSLLITSGLQVMIFGLLADMIKVLLMRKSLPQT